VRNSNRSSFSWQSRWPQIKSRQASATIGSFSLELYKDK